MAWYVLRTNNRQERLAVTALTERGVTAYCPVEVRKLIIPGRPKSSKTLVICPGYVFAVLPDDHAIDVAISIHAIRGIMCNGNGDLRPVSTSEIRGFFLAEIFHMFDETWEAPKPKKAKYSHAWKPGDTVRIKTGPWAGFDADVKEARNSAKLLIAVAIFGRETPIEIDARDVESPHLEQYVAPKRAA